MGLDLVETGFLGRLDQIFVGMKRENICNYLFYTLWSLVL